MQIKIKPDQEELWIKAKHPSYREPMWGDQPGGVTRDHARPQRWLRSPHTVISPAAAVPMSAVSFDPLPPLSLIHI